MKETVFEAGDVVRLDHYLFGKHNGQLATVVKVCENEITVRTGDSLEWVVTANSVISVTLEEQREELGECSVPRTLMDGSSVNEMEEGQEESYRMFRGAVNEARREAERKAAEEEKEYRGALFELAVTAILWAVFTTLSLIMWTVMTWKNDGVIPWIGLVSAWAGTVTVFKPMVALILVCRERIKERQRGRRHNIK